MSFFGRAVRSLIGGKEQEQPATTGVQIKQEPHHPPTPQHHPATPTKSQPTVASIKLDKKVLEKINDLKKLWVKYVNINEEAERSLLLYKILPAFNTIFQTMDTKNLSES